MKDNLNNMEPLQNGSSIFPQSNNDKDISYIKNKLLNFLNDYDIFDTDFITYDDVEEDLSTSVARKELINYLYLVKHSENNDYEFINKINEIIKDIKSFDNLGKDLINE